MIARPAGTRPAARLAVTLVGAAVTLVFGYYAVRGVRFGDLWPALRSSRWWWLVPALVTLALAFGIRAVRWRYLFPASVRPPLRAATESLTVCFFFNNVMPARAGDAIRIVDLRQRAGTPAPETTGTVVIERAYDVMVVLGLLFVTSPWLPHVSWIRAAAILAIVLGLGLALLAVALTRWGDGPQRRIARLLAHVPFVREEAAAAALAGLVTGLAALRGMRLALGALVLTTLAWIVSGISAWFVMLQLDLGLSPLAGMLVMIAIGLGMILPSSPGAVGVFEAAAVVSLSAYGVEGARALSFALMLHVINLVPFLVAGPLVLRRSHVREAARRAPRPVSEGL